MTPDSNFVDDDWDEDSPERRSSRNPLEDSTNSLDESPFVKKKMNFRGEEKNDLEESKEGNNSMVGADSNFATEDWD